MKFEIHFEFRASLRNFQYLNFWDATVHKNLDEVLAERKAISFSHSCHKGAGPP